VIDWTPYLESVCKKYAQWWNFYTLTDVAGKMRSPDTSSWLMDLRAQTVQESRNDDEEKTEQYSVLEGLRKYAANHVLLVGRPGSGKSTAFARLLLEECKKAQGLLGEHSHQEKIVQIPILLELRYYETSIIDLILQFLKRHDLMIDSSELETVLLEKADVQLLLLFDGVNELPSEKGRLDLQHFRNLYGKVSMIFSTRDLGLGGDLNLEKRFEMLPLTEPKMKEFVRAYLPENSEEMLKQLGDHLREFGQTPLLLWMLCSVFENNDSQIPSNLGLVFRRFTEIYDHQLKADVSTFQESREWWRGLLRVLAWKMTEGESKTEIKVAISRREAELELTTFVLDQGFLKYYAKKWLEDLLKHHLIQLEGNDQITFRHQLIQEYYAAEMLLEKFSDLGDWELQWNYLNYLKWTEPFALMLGMIENKAKAIHIVKLALAVDIKLGARLAGEVKEDFQKETIALVLVLELKLPQLFKIELLGITRSNIAIPLLIKDLEHSDFKIREKAAEFLGKIGSEVAISSLIKALEDPVQDVESIAAEALCQMGSELAVPDLIKALKKSNSNVCWRAAYILQFIGSEIAIPWLLNALEDSSWDVRYHAAQALCHIDPQQMINKLLNALEDSNENIRWKAAEALGNTGEILENISLQLAISKLIKTLKDSNNIVRWNSARALGNIGSEKAIDGLLNALQDFDREVCYHAAEALGQIGSQKAIPRLKQALENSNKWIRRNAASALGQIGSQKADSCLLKALNDSSQQVRGSAAFALGRSGSKKALSALLNALKDIDPEIRKEVVSALGWINVPESINALLKSLEDSDNYVRSEAAKALGDIRSELAIQGLLKALEDLNTDVRWNAAQALGNIRSQKAISGLLKVLNDDDENVRWEATSALRKIGSEIATKGFLKALNDFDGDVRWEAAAALGEIGSEETLSILFNTLKNPTFVTSNDGDTFYQAYSAISKIQQKVKYYSPIPEQNNLNNLPPQTPTASPQSVNYYDFRGATVGSFAGIVQGNQQVTQINQKNYDSTT
jgi:HEAT repeat protein